jgi:hypothetical protein
VAPINVITKEQVVCVRRVPCIVHEPEQVVVLPVDVSTNNQWCFQPQEHRLLTHYFQGTINDLVYHIYV